MNTNTAIVILLATILGVTIVLATINIWNFDRVPFDVNKLEE